MDLPIPLFIAILLVGVLIFIVMSVMKPKSHNFDQDRYQSDFLEIENTLTKENELSYSVVITNADKLLDKALCEMGLPGRTMGDRLKSPKLKEKFSSLNSVWYAHKLRNQIAHEHNFKPDYNQAKHALATYREALKNLGAV
ncbi:hypothetical protein FACS1894191_1350 [Clostridia bacterium]|nr:hypothetical protein FACS1894191_1350 [Clostridia bacterium]